MPPEGPSEGDPVLLDTTAFSYLLRGEPKDQPYIDLVTGHSLAISFITVGEALSGAVKRGWQGERLAQLEIRLAACAIIPGTIGVARHYAHLQAHFGTSKGPNDLWIAACALAVDPPLPIVSGDHDFDEICAYAGIPLMRP